MLLSLHSSLLYIGYRLSYSTWLRNGFRRICCVSASGLPCCYFHESHCFISIVHVDPSDFPGDVIQEKALFNAVCRSSRQFYFTPDKVSCIHQQRVYECQLLVVPFKWMCSLHWIWFGATSWDLKPRHGHDNLSSPVPGGYGPICLHKLSWTTKTSASQLVWKYSSERTDCWSSQALGGTAEGR